MLAKTVEKGGAEWDEQLPCFIRLPGKSTSFHSGIPILFAVWARPSIAHQSRVTMHLHEYGVELYTKMANAWELARKFIGQAQRHQKANYDKKATDVPFRSGERVFLYKPAEKTGEARKLARPFHGPYRISEMDNNTATIFRVDRPEQEPLLVAIDRLRRCPEQLGPEFWPPSKRPAKKTKDTGGPSAQSEKEETETVYTAHRKKWE